MWACSKLSGVATLLLRDRDGQLKSSYDSSQEAPPGKSDPRFLSTLVECAVQGKRMDFEVRRRVKMDLMSWCLEFRAVGDGLLVWLAWLQVKTPVNRVKNYKSKRVSEREGPCVGQGHFMPR